MPKPYPREFREDVIRVARGREPDVLLKQVAADFRDLRGVSGELAARVRSPCPLRPRTMSAEERVQLALRSIVAREPGRAHSSVWGGDVGEQGIGTTRNHLVAPSS